MHKVADFEIPKLIRMHKIKNSFIITKTISVFSGLVNVFLSQYKTSQHSAILKQGYILHSWYDLS